MQTRSVRGFDRRAFLGAATAFGAAAAFGGAARAAVQSADWTAPVPDIRFRYAASAISWGPDIEQAIRVVSRLGLPGLEPFRENVVHYLDKPLALRRLFDEAGVTMVSCSNGGPNFSGKFFDAAAAPATIRDHVAFARDFIRPIGTCDHFKMNLGPRPPGGVTSDDHIKIAADTLNAIGRQTLEFGIRLAPHPHVNSLIELEHEVRQLMALTDPRYVWITCDTSHLTLGGMDPFRIISDYWPRVAEIHYKDSAPGTRGATTLQVPKTGPHAGGHGYFRNLGGKDSGGVDFPKIQQFLIDRKYAGWVTLDLDASMIEGADMEETLKINLNYLHNVLGVPRAML